MAATSTSVSPRPQHNPATLKFTAVKVDVSALTNVCRCKAFVISSQTTSRDLADMVLRKLKIDVRDHVKGTCIMGKPSDGGEKRILASDERVLGLLGNKNKRTLTLELVPVEAVSDHDHVSSVPRGGRDDVDCIKAGNLSDPTKNGMTLPGYKKTDVNYNLPIGSGFLTSTPNPDNCDSMASTVDSGFIIHYEPCIENPPPYKHSKGARLRSKSFELARDNGYRLDDSTGNASDSGMVLNGNAQHNGLHEDGTPETYPCRPSPKDGFQILQSQNSAWTPFSRHVSDGFIKSFSHQVLPTTSSVPDVSHDPSGANFKRRRSLPKLSISQEQLEEKKKSVTNLFASKLKDYIQKAQTSKHGKSSANARRRYNVPQRSINRDEDTMSVTSQEVAEIMSSASPMKPYEEDDMTDSEDEACSRTKSAHTTPNNVFQPVTFVSEPSQSPELIQQQLEHVNINGDSQKSNKHSLGKFVEESMKTFINIETPEKSKDVIQSSGPNSPHNIPDTPNQPPSDRGVPLFTLLTTHLMAPVMVRRNRERAPNKFIGIRLCDVTYAKCVRHVIKHWATSSRHFSVDPTLSERMLVAIGGVDRRTTVILAGKLFRGDIIVEINGKSALGLPARDVISRMIPAEVVSLVVARSRLNVERSQSP